MPNSFTIPQWKTKLWDMILEYISIHTHHYICPSAISWWGHNYRYCIWPKQHLCLYKGTSWLCMRHRTINAHIFTGLSLWLRVTGADNLTISKTLSFFIFHFKASYLPMTMSSFSLMLKLQNLFPTIQNDLVEMCAYKKKKVTTSICSHSEKAKLKGHCSSQLGNVLQDPVPVSLNILSLRFLKCHTNCMALKKILGLRCLVKRAPSV